MKRKMIIACALASVIAITPIFAQQSGQGQRQRQQRVSQQRQNQQRVFTQSPHMALRFLNAENVDRMAANIELTDSQKNQIKEFIANDSEALKALQTKANTSSKAFIDALYDENYDADTAEALLLAAQKDEAAVISAQLKTWKNVRAVLTAEQVKKLKESPSMMGGNRPDGEGRQRATVERRQRSGGERSASPPDATVE